MSIPQLGFGMLFGAICLLFILFSLKQDKRFLSWALILAGIYMAHDAYGNRLLPPPNEVAIYTMAIIAGLVLGTGLRILLLADRPKGRTSSYRLSIPNGAEMIIKEAGKPLHAEEIVEALQGHGKVFESIRPSVSVTSSLSRDARFVRTGRNIFGLVELGHG